MSRTALLLLLLCICSSAVGFTVSLPPQDLSKTTVYEILESYGFPVGLLPEGVTGYDLDESSGKFSAYLKGPCVFSPRDTYQLQYEPTISGTVSLNHLSNLSGISVKVLLFWFDIIEVQRSGDDLEFSVGVTSANFPVDNFSECPQCGGVYCPSSGGRED
ncbi:hypothetical protein J5N97_013217 [Dioscorea zingiberensis]|uniref:Uncharacterized protein n=1 Tax=Dioscorea zingiberensis TaxID=325984 RepID=A0A9D5CQT9_9LILI|nr:hypothetical protein J5N97_013217 [Dioscorea zingiberensis]